MKLKELLQKIAVNRREEHPFPEDLDAYLEDFIPNTLLKSDTLQIAFGVTNEEMEVLYKEAYTFYTKEDFTEATTEFRYLVILDPFTKKYWLGLAACLQVQEFYEKALHSYAMAALLDGEDPYPHFYAYQCYEKSGNQEDAQKALQLAYERTEGRALFVSLRQQIEPLLALA